MILILIEKKNDIISYHIDLITTNFDCEYDYVYDCNHKENELNSRRSSSDLLRNNNHIHNRKLV